MHPPVNAWVFEHGHRHLRSEKNSFRAVRTSSRRKPKLFNREGDFLAAKLRPGNVHSADGWGS